MSNWPATKARRVLAAPERIGWRVKRQSGSHKLLAQELGRGMLSRVASDGRGWRRVLLSFATTTALAVMDGLGGNVFRRLNCSHQAQRP